MNDIAECADDILSESEQFHQAFDANVKALMEPIRDGLLNSTVSCSPEEIIGELLMNLINNDGFTGNDPESAFAGKFNTKQKQNLVAVAHHIGPDWAQAFYHAAVFMTKVA